ncbi:MAG: carboxypeptidase regulatory-like domain-containing protein [Gemmatimonadaceae bacterium]
MAAPAHAQQRGLLPPSGAFTGRVINQSDSSVVNGAAIHLLRIDSTRAGLSGAPGDADMIYVDSLKTRFGTTDSSGAFAIREVEAGRYLLQIRRIGFRPREGVLTVDSLLIRVTLPLEPTVQALAGMTITETAVDRNGAYLKNVGYTFRSQGGLGGRFLTNATMVNERWWTLGEALHLQFIDRADVVVDGLPAQFADIINYPVAQIMAVEIYRSVRPLEFDFATWKAGQFSTRAPLVLVWTFRP